MIRPRRAFEADFQGGFSSGRAMILREAGFLGVVEEECPPIVETYEQFNGNDYIISEPPHELMALDGDTVCPNCKAAV